MTVLFEPAEAIAAGHCLTARTISRAAQPAATTAHPRRCAWCDWPAEELRSMVEGYNAWAGYDPARGTYGRHEARVFQDLPRAEQQRQVIAAQGLEEPVAEPVQPVDTAPPPPADAEEDAAMTPSWML